MPFLLMSNGIYDGFNWISENGAFLPVYLVTYSVLLYFV